MDRPDDRILFTYFLLWLYSITGDPVIDGMFQAMIEVEKFMRGIR